MKIFGQIVRTVVETVKLPVDAVLDVVDLMDSDREIGGHTSERLKKIKEAATEED